MSDFINTIDELGDKVVMNSIVDGTISEFKDSFITTVHNSTFRDCTNLHTIDLPNCEDVKEYGFSGCTNLTSINLPKCTSAGNSAFYHTAIEEINMPSLTNFTLGYEFKNCEQLKNINMPKLTNLSEGCFQNCYALEEVCFANVEIARRWAFQSCPVKTVDLPKCKALTGAVFYICTSLTTLLLRTEEAVCTTDSQNPFTGNWSGTNGPISKGEGYIYVPRALIEDYKVATNWSNFANQFRALEDYTVDGTVTGKLDETKI